MVEKLKSRKFLVAIIGALLTAINGYLGYPVPHDTMVWVDGLLGTWVASEAVVDGARTLRSGGVA